MSTEDRARAEAQRRTRPGISGQTVPTMEQFAKREGYVHGFIAGAVWQAEQDPTAAEIEAGAQAVSDHMAADGTRPDPAYAAEIAIAALLAAKEARS